VSGSALSVAVVLRVVPAGLLVKAGFAAAAMYYVGSQLAEVGARLRLDLIDRVLNARWTYYIRQPVGRFTNAIGGEVARAAQAYICVATLFSLLIQVMIYTVLSLR